MRWLDFQRDLSSCWRKHKSGEITWKEWLQTIVPARSFAYLDRKDLRPFIYSVYLFLKIAFLTVGEWLQQRFTRIFRIGTGTSRASKENAKDRPLRVMHIVHWLGLAGMEYGVIKLVNRLDPERYVPMICCLDTQKQVTRALLDRRIAVFELKRREGIDWRMILTLAALLRRERVDIVHSHNWTTFFYAV